MPKIIIEMTQIGFNGDLAIWPMSEKNLSVELDSSNCFSFPQNLQF